MALTNKPLPVNDKVVIELYKAVKEHYEKRPTPESVYLLCWFEDELLPHLIDQKRKLSENSESGQTT